MRFPWMGGSDYWLPGMRGRFFESGEVRLAVLSLLSEGPRHGYDLIKEMEARSKGAYKVSAGTIYPTLQLLEDEGLAVSEQQDNRRVYHITDAGRGELEREKETVDRIWERARHWAEWSAWTRSPAVVASAHMRDLIAAAVRASARASGDRELGDRIRAILDRARKELEDLAPPNPA